MAGTLSLAPHGKRPNVWRKLLVAVRASWRSSSSFCRYTRVILLHKYMIRSPEECSQYEWTKTADEVVRKGSGTLCRSGLDSSYSRGVYVTGSAMDPRRIQYMSNLLLNGAREVRSHFQQTSYSSATGMPIKLFSVCL